jgi:hypothetical protein
MQQLISRPTLGVQVAETASDPEETVRLPLILGEFARRAKAHGSFSLIVFCGAFRAVVILVKFLNQSLFATSVTKPVLVAFAANAIIRIIAIAGATAQNAKIVNSLTFLIFLIPVSAGKIVNSGRILRVESTNQVDPSMALRVVKWERLWSIVSCPAFHPSGFSGWSL